MLLSSGGLVFQKHYCQYELKEISLFLEVEACHSSEPHEAMCPFHARHQMPAKDDKSNCCDDETEWLKLDQDFQVEIGQALLLKSLLSSAPLLSSNSICGEAILTSPTHYLNYKPPLLVSDFSISLQTFLC